jgi:diguanylate cyclase (GGDEF)-like protein
MESAVAQWAPAIPVPLREAFRTTFMRFAHDHDQALATIETIWGNRDRSYAFDETTGLARRQPFMSHLASLLGSSSEDAGAACVLFLDLNGLKSINDRCGHAAGDRAISAAAKIIREVIRVDRHEDMMIRSGDEDFSISRNGGDEFLIGLQLKKADDIASVAPRVKRHIDDPGRQRACGYVSDQPLSVSVGGMACRLPVPPLPPAPIVRALIAMADSQMYASKKDGLVHIAIGHFTTRLEVEREEIIPKA